MNLELLNYSNKNFNNTIQIKTTLNKMKKITLVLLLLVSVIYTKAQNGIENIIVEKYYISDANDTSANSTDGILPIGSTTYRVFVDMLPGYKFQAAFGIATHELKIATTTLFFNNEDRGGVTPYFTKNQARSQTVMLDSWLSVGAACANNFGILKTLDDTVNTSVNLNGILQNDDPIAGIPLTERDGCVPGAPLAVTLVGISTQAAMFDSQNDGTNGPVFSTFDGSWAALGGSTGPDSLDNKVLIGQFTTDGDFSFELNIQIGTPDGGVQQFVAKDPTLDEITIPSLTYFNQGYTNNHSITKNKSSFEIYPNPTNNQFTIKILDSKSQSNFYSIYDSKGTLVMHNNINESNKNKVIDISNFSSGLYFVVVSIEGNVSSEKIVKN